MKISASIYAQAAISITQLANQLKQLHVDFLHVDSIENKLIFKDIDILNKENSLPLDLHIITDTPAEYYTLINTYNIYSVAFQYENINAIIDFKKYIPNIRVGIAILNTTSLSIIEEYLPYIDYVLLMTTTPGISGGAFNKETFKRVRLVKAKFPKLPICVDGGVNAEVSFILRNMGVETSVVGSYLFKTNTIAEALINLRLQHTLSNYLVSDIMIDLEELPVIYDLSMPLFNVLQVIEQYKLGFLFVIDNQNNLKGIISNADVRKGLIKNYTSIQNITAQELLNKNPFTIEFFKTIEELLLLIKKQSFPIMYLPVVNESKLCGAITFNNLIKGE